jgi:uncharacterized protein DUF222/HNH endonuclease
MYVLFMLQIEDALIAAHRRECASLRRELVLIAELDRREAWRMDGALSMADWVSFRFGCSEQTARLRVKAGNALEGLPAIGDTMEAGLLPWDKVRWLIEFATPDEDATLASDAIGMSYAQVRELALYRRRLAREAADARFKRRYLRMYTDVEEGFVRLWGRLPDADGEAFRVAIERIAEHAPAGKWEQRCADALAEMASLSLGADPDSDRATIVAHVEASVLTSDDRVGMLEGGTPVVAETIRRLTCDGRLQTIAHDEEGTPIGVGRVTRTVPHYLRRQLRSRDGGCVIDGCSNTRWLQAHHKHHWAHGGRTDEQNLVTICGSHHRMVHEGGRVLRRCANGKYRVVPARAP